MSTLRNSISDLGENDKMPNELKTNFIHIECVSVLKAMYNGLYCYENEREIRDCDNGQNGESPPNNTEYGGNIESKTGVISFVKGVPGDPSRNRTVEIQLNTNHSHRSCFHSHPSGTKTINLNVTIGEKYSTSSWQQGPSSEDASNASNTVRYVFAMRDKMIYVYNSTGIVATLSFKVFNNL